MPVQRVPVSIHRSAAKAGKASRSAGKRQRISWSDNKPKVTPVTAPKPALKPRLWFQEGERRVFVPQRLVLKPDTVTTVAFSIGVKLLSLVPIATEHPQPRGRKGGKGKAATVAVEVRPHRRSPSQMLEEEYAATALATNTPVLPAYHNPRHAKEPEWSVVGCAAVDCGATQLGAVLAPGMYDIRVSGAKVPVLVFGQQEGVTECLV